MKKFQLLNWILVVFVIFQFSSCEDEPLEGEFVNDGCSVTASEGYLRATVDLTLYNRELPQEGEYSFDGAIQVVHENGFKHLNINSLFNEEGEKISIEIINPSVGIHVLATPNEFGFVDNVNNHELLKSFGLYTTNEDDYPYVTYIPLGAVGTVDLTLYDETAQLVSGTFSFTASRTKRDPVTGEVELDAGGNPIIETVEVSCGSFNNIPFVIIDDSSGGSNPSDEFFAKVDGEEFEDTNINITTISVNGIPMVKIEAFDDLGGKIRIDLPEDLGTGTFAMESQSDGTKLIAQYNPNTGGEDLSSNPGTITITKFNTNTGVIEATFEFTASDPLNVDPTVAEITEGSFAIDYIISGGDQLNNITAEVDGDFFDPDTITIEETIFNGQTRISAVALDTPNNRKLGIFFPKNIEIGTYDMEAVLSTGEEKFSQFTPDVGTSITYTSIPGTLTVTEYNLDTGIIEGTFSYTAVDILNIDPTVYEITNGEFILDLD